jgi:hypothetical protein
MEEQTRTLLAAFAAVLTTVAQETANLMEARTDLIREQVAATRVRAEALRQDAKRVQSLLAAIQ